MAGFHIAAQEKKKTGVWRVGRAIVKKCDFVIGHKVDYGSCAQDMRPKPHVVARDARN